MVRAYKMRCLPGVVCSPGAQAVGSFEVFYGWPCTQEHVCGHVAMQVACTACACVFCQWCLWDGVAVHTDMQACVWRHSPFSPCMPHLLPAAVTSAKHHQHFLLSCRCVRVCVCVCACMQTHRPEPLVLAVLSQLWLRACCCGVSKGKFCCMRLV
jgi:hypothetical protein